MYRVRYILFFIAEMSASTCRYILCVPQLLKFVQKKTSGINRRYPVYPSREIMMVGTRNPSIIGSLIFSQLLRAVHQLGAIKHFLFLYVSGSK